MIAIMDYGLGNLGSIVNMFRVIGIKSMITSDKETIEKSTGIVLPGVGAFDAGMNRLNEAGLSELIKSEAYGGKPILGICLGMQLLGNKSEEGQQHGLGLIPFKCRKFHFENAELKIPHMGWDVVDYKQEHPVLKGIRGQQRYYFVHSYYAVCDDETNVLMTCEYGFEFAAAVVKGNVIGVQFHPEKSHDFGMALLRNFADMCCGD